MLTDPEGDFHKWVAEADGNYGPALELQIPALCLCETVG